MTPNEQDEPRLTDEEIEELVKWACSIFSGGKNPQQPTNCPNCGADMGKEVNDE